MQRYICVHGHFYQPPRENPWLEEVESQDSAYPYHDWNERITAECYAANAASRILDSDGRIASIVNNYELISFNFGATLLSWMRRRAPETYAGILAADARSMELRSGHGSALAQCYSHSILPLANTRDKRTEIIWGVRDFRFRFGREPEGMWLPETAVDLESLEIMAGQGVRFTVLAPHQAARVRTKGSREWDDVRGGQVDPTRAYAQQLPSGRSIAVFFYDGPVSQAVAFEKLLVNGETFSHRLSTAFSAERDWPQLVHIATDGETYGHHHLGGDMALAYALRHIEESGIAKLTNYGEYLERHPPQAEVQIAENSSWSCVHGVDRWRDDCGCTTGGRPGWNQQWRRPLRDALNWLRDDIAPRFESLARGLLNDPWAARDDYIDVLVDRTPERTGAFLERRRARDLSADERVRCRKLLEMQRACLQMFTSCGWFFEELARIEAVQVLRYAARAMQLCHDLTGHDPEPEFLDRFAEARSNVPELGNGRDVYERFAKPAMLTLEKVGAHYALSSLFVDYGPGDRIYCYDVEREDSRRIEVGHARLDIGRAVVASVITGESARLTYAALHMGDHNLTGGVRPFQSDEAYATLRKSLADAFEKADFTGTVRAFERTLGEHQYSLKALFRDQQRAVLDRVLASTLDNFEAAYRRLFNDHFALMRFLSETDAPLPRALRAAAEMTIDTDLRRLFQEGNFDEAQLDWRLEATREMSLRLDDASLGFTLQSTIERLASDLQDNGDGDIALKALERAVDVAHRSYFPVEFWKAQNVVYRLLHPDDDRARADRRKRLAGLAERLHIRVD